MYRADRLPAGTTSEGLPAFFGRRLLLRLTVFALLVVALWSRPANTDASCVVLSWTATGDDGYSGVAKEYDVRYSLEYITEANWNSTSVARCYLTPKPSGQRETLVIDGLESDRTYYFAMKVADEHANWSALSNVVARVAPPDKCLGSTGNANCSDDDLVTIGDVTQCISYLYMNGYLCCTSEADADKNGYVSIGDISLMIDHLYMAQLPLDPCD